MKIFLFSFKMAIKTAGSAQKIRVGRVSGNTAILFRPYSSAEGLHAIHVVIPTGRLHTITK